MAEEPAFQVKLILGDLEELIEREDELSIKSDFLSSYFEEWVNSMSRLSAIWNTAGRDQLNQIISKYEEVKPIAMKLKLPWPEDFTD